MVLLVVQQSANFLGFLRGVALLTVLLGAMGSLRFMLQAGRRQGSLLLIGLFTVWVLSPFVALVYAHMVAKGWPADAQASIYSLMLIFTLGSLACYGYVVLGSPRPQPAFVFLVVPLASWVLIFIVALTTRKLLPPKR